MKPIRYVLGNIITFFDRITRPTPMSRDPEEQEIVDEQLNKMSLYQFEMCPFCVKVRRALHELNLDIEFRDARNNEKHRTDLKQGGGKIQVPCLRIDHEEETEWMYESDDIIAFLRDKFGEKSE
ncbi:MAG: glutathione S-transferase N-terminal domain-containing protein [bacterium]